jgi:hypothetical protein
LVKSGKDPSLPAQGPALLVRLLALLALRLALLALPGCCESHWI